MKYLYLVMSVALCSCGSASVLNEQRYTLSGPRSRSLEFGDGSSTFLYIEPYGPDSFGSYVDISPTERVLRSRWQDLYQIPATLDSVQVPLVSNDSTYVLLTTSIRAGGLDFYREILSFVVETPRGGSASVSYLRPAAVPQLHRGDSLRVTLTLDRERIVPRPTTNPVSSEWVRLTTDATMLRVRLDVDASVFNYRVVNDTLRATRRGWRWGRYEFTPDSQLDINRRGL